ncbi:50S ribosomal protein L23 [bacterium]|nr:50S ribosomal protein L23 [candidate division CSSED10-310 bacterium]
MKRDPRTIIVKPIITERSTSLKDRYNQVLFQVHIDANKIEIHKAVEEIFNVEVENVRTFRVKGKFKRLGRYEGWRSDWKKAIVTLKQGHSIELFEGV